LYRDAHPPALPSFPTRRSSDLGDTVTFVVNRNVNFTNVCIKHCTFCAFSRDHREEEGYLLPVEEVVRRAREAAELGASEVCIQRSEEHTSELQSRGHLVCRLLL